MPHYWTDWGSCQIIYREAKTLVEGKPYTDEPLWLIATGRERALLGYNERAEKDFQEAVTILARPSRMEQWPGYCRPIPVGVSHVPFLRRMLRKCHAIRMRRSAGDTIGQIMRPV
jgi:hypothetical protein